MVTTMELIIKNNEQINKLRKEYEELGCIDEFDKLYNAWVVIKQNILNWYRVKYPDSVIVAFQEKYKDRDSMIMLPQEYNFIQMNNLSKHMGYKELMLRIPERYHSILECEYENIKGKIYLKNTNDKVEEEFSIDKSGYFKKCPRSFKVGFTEDIESLYRVINKENYDVSEMEKIIKLHHLSLKFRMLFFESMIGSLLGFLSNNQVIGFVRAKLFIEEFNKYIYDLNLDENIINNKIKEYINKDELNSEIDYILNELKNNENTIEDFGLTFNTLKILEFYNIKELNDIKSGKFEYLLSTGNDSIWNFQILKRDREILGKMFHKFVICEKDYDFGLSKALNYIEEPKKKRKLFGRKK